MRTVNTAIINKMLQAKHFKIVLLRYYFVHPEAGTAGPKKQLGNGSQRLPGALPGEQAAAAQDRLPPWPSWSPQAHDDC